MKGVKATGEVVGNLAGDDVECWVGTIVATAGEIVVGEAVGIRVVGDEERGMVGSSVEGLVVGGAVGTFVVGVAVVGVMVDGEEVGRAVVG